MVGRSATLADVRSRQRMVGHRTVLTTMTLLTTTEARDAYRTLVRLVKIKGATGGTLERMEQSIEEVVSANQS